MKTSSFDMTCGLGYLVGDAILPLLYTFPALVVNFQPCYANFQPWNVIFSFVCLLGFDMGISSFSMNF